MKKLLALILTVAMVMTMITVPAAAATTVGNMKVNLSTPTSNGGLYGKAATEYATAMTTDASNPAKANFTVTSSADFDFSDKKYIVLDLNVAPNGSATAISVGPNAGLFTIDSNAFVTNRWNSVRVVIEEKTAAEMQTLGTYQPMTMYINGVKVADAKASSLAGGDITNVGAQIYGKGFRFNIKGAASTMVGYVADINLSASDVNEANVVATLVAGTGYTMDGANIKTDGTATVADVASANSSYTVTAYEDDSFSKVLDDSAVLVPGNIVMAKTAAGTYSYYDVTDVNTTILFTASNGSIPSTDLFKATQESVSGIGGKALDDAAIKLTATTETDGNIMYQKNSVYTQAKNYFVLEGSVYPVDGDIDMRSVSVHTNNATSGHATVSGEISGFSLNQWNKFLMYVDFTGETPKAYSYVNGALVKEQNAEAVFGDSNSNIRICFHGGAKAEIFELYADDLKYYETNNLPAGTTATARPALENSSLYTAEDGKFKIQPGVTVAQVVAANPDLTVRVFKDNTYAETVADTAALEAGMVVVFENSKKAINAFTVAISYGETEIDLRTGDTGAAFPTVANGTGEIVSGFAGKAATDNILAVTPNVTGNTDTHIALKSWGTVVNTGADNSVTPTWSKSDYNGYLVVEASVFNVDNTTIALVTTQTNQISGNVATAIPANQWARVKFVYNAVDGDANEGKTMTYVNGKAVTEWVNSSFGKLAAYTTNNYMCNDIRLSMKGSASGAVATYIDDIRVYETPALRAEESIAFTAPEGAYATDTQFTYAEGVTVTVGDVKALNPDVTIYNNSTSYTEITDETAVLTDGNIIFASAASQSTKDAGYSYNDIFKVLTVGEMSATKDVITTFPLSATRGTISDAAGGKFENTSDVKLVTDDNTSDSNWYSSNGYAGLSAGMKYLVWEVDIAPTEDVKDMYFATGGHAALSGRANVGMQLTANRWNKVIMVYDVANDTSDMYVNGSLISEAFAGNYAEKYNNSIELRMVVDCKQGALCYFDTFRIYDSAVYPTITQPAKLAEGYANKILANYASATADINTSVTVADVASAMENGTAYAFEDNTYATQLGNTDTFDNGNVLVLKTDDNVFTVYNVTVHGSDNIIVAGDTYDGAGNMTTGTIGLYAPVTDGGVLFAAQYDAQGNLIKIAMDNTPENDTLSIDFETEEVDKTKVRAFLFENTDSIKPLCENVEIDVRDEINFLILGNSYSMDVTWHLRQIAAADDVIMNISVLNKGGCHLRYHYDNRQGNPAELGINFWENNKSLGTLYNLEQTLEKFDWDYVAIQASSTTQGLDDTSDANYEENWAVAVPFAQYIHEMEPDARIAIHSTWSMETGYNFVDSDETRDQIMDNMRTLNNRCAEDINTTLGLEGDDKVLVIYSTDIIDAARAYAPAEDVTINGRTCPAGTKIFDTTYYKDGHVFTFEEANVRDVAVGDGTMLLSEADKLAGKISLHRDGFHMSAVGRYLIALNAYATITGNTVTGNTFDSADATRADGTIRLDSSPGGLHVTETDTNTSSTVYQIYDILTPEVRALCQQLVDSLER